MYSRFFKRFFDVVLAAAALIIFSPLMLLTALAIYFEDRQNVFFRQKRVGRSGQSFICLKFRSMPVNAANVPKTAAGMIKITRVGKFIRRINIDELPQLFNILRGEMSLVGPRPAIPAQHDLCRMRDINGASNCAPGLTGLAQINGYDGMPETEKATWDGNYARKVTLFQDSAIILKTFRHLARKPPIY